MKMIEVLNMIAEGKIKEGTKLKNGYKIYDYINDYTDDSDDCSFVNQEYGGTRFLEDSELITKSFLNLEVELIEPKPKKYQLKLYEDDDFSYVTRSSYDSCFNYDISDKNEICEFVTKFTQEEIDNEKLLKFVEKYGIKEEVE